MMPSFSNVPRNSWIPWRCAVALCTIFCYSTAQKYYKNHDVAKRLNCIEYVSQKWRPYESEDTPRKSLACVNDRNVKNASCYLCGQQCKTMEDIKHARKKNNGLTCGKQTIPIEIKCCVVAQMSNIGRPPSSGQYKCYRKAKEKAVIELLLDCPFGKMGTDCQKAYIEPFNCSCFPGHILFPGQEYKPDCSVKNKDPTTSTCHISVSRYGEMVPCVCSKSTDLEGSNMGSCSRPQIDKYGSGSQRHQSNSIFMLILACCVQWWKYNMQLP